MSKTDRRWKIAAGAFAVVALSLLSVGGLAAAPSAPTTEGCRPGVYAEVMNDGTWRLCAEASPTPSPSTPSPSPTTPAPTTPPPSPSASPTPSPTVSPTPTATPPGPVLLTGCMTRLAECGYPHPGNTGVPAGVTLTPYTGPMTIRTAGTVIDGKAIGCGLAVSAANVTIRNSKITGPCFYGVDILSGNLTIEDTEIDCVNHKGTGVAFENYVARRLEVRNCENGFWTGDNTTVQDSYITGVVEVDGGHGDGMQGSSGTNIQILRNTFDINHGTDGITSSIIWDNLTMNNVLVEGNFFASGAFTVYCPTGSNITYRSNRFYGPAGNWGVDPYRPAFGYSTSCGSSVTWTGNYADHNLAAVPRA